MRFSILCKWYIQWIILLEHPVCKGWIFQFNSNPRYFWLLWFHLIIYYVWIWKVWNGLFFQNTIIVSSILSETIWNILSLHILASGHSDIHSVQTTKSFLSLWNLFHNTKLLLSSSTNFIRWDICGSSEPFFSLLSHILFYNTEFVSSSRKNLFGLQW